jgi:glucokinase
MSLKEVALGIDIGGTNTKLGFVDRDGVSHADTSIPTGDDDVEFYLPRLYRAVDQLLEPIKKLVKVVGVGIGVPNGNYYKGTVEKPSNLKWRDFTPLAEWVETHYGVPTRLTNDANAAAIGEMRFGAARGMKNFVMITLGTGLGSGFVVDGKLAYGHDGFAGELGHVIVDTDGRIGPFKRRGPLEAYVSAPGICRTVFEILARRTEESELRSISFEELTAAQVFQAAKRGDVIALEAFDFTGKILGRKLSDVMAILSPEAFILFGGLAGSGDYLFQPTHKYMEEYMMPIFKNKVKLLPSAMQDVNAAVLGAAALIWHELEPNS